MKRENIIEAIKNTMLPDCDECFKDRYTQRMVNGVADAIMKASEAELVPEPVEETRDSVFIDGVLYERVANKEPVEEKKVCPRCNGTGECIEPVMQGFGNYVCEVPTNVIYECQREEPEKEEPEWVKEFDELFDKDNMLVKMNSNCLSNGHKMLVEFIKEQLNKFAKDVQSLPWGFVKEKWGIE